MTYVNASLLSIITESLYDRPIVVFREYVQNSSDSFEKARSKGAHDDDLRVIIWRDGNDLLFLDNGDGIPFDDFEGKMKGVGSSEKTRVKNFGYKGIGRLSGFPYCEMLEFYNIVEYSNGTVQKFELSNPKLTELKRSEQDFNALSFDEMFDRISEYKEVEVPQDEWLRKTLVTVEKQYSVFKERDKGFLVVLRGISNVLNQAIKSAKIYNELGWMLPVAFSKELLHAPVEKYPEVELFQDITENLPRTSNVFFNGQQIFRPIGEADHRAYTFKREFDKYAFGFCSVNSDFIKIDQTKFHGIRIYIKNILLCDETELITMLKQFGLLSQTMNELIQTTRGIGAIIYITDLVNLIPNARRTFIEVTNSESIEFLTLLAGFIEQVYKLRYALSGYQSSLKNQAASEAAKINDLKLATDAFVELAQERVEVDFSVPPPKEFNDLMRTEQMQIIKKLISKGIGVDVREYLLQKSELQINSAYNDFKVWLCASKK